MMIKWNRYTKGMAVALCLGMVLSACEDFADETYELSATDELAIHAMSDTFLVTMPLKAANILKDGTGLGVILTNGDADTVIMPVDSNMLTLNNVYEALESAGITRMTANDTAYAVNAPADSLSFRVIDIPSNGTYVIYLNHHFNARLYNPTTMDLVAAASDDMSPELIAGLYIEEGNTLIPVIKSRQEYDLSSGHYLLEMSRMETTTRASFRVVLIHEQ